MMSINCNCKKKRYRAKQTYFGQNLSKYIHRIIRCWKQEISEILYTH